MSPKSPQYRTLPHLQHGIDGSHHGVHTMMKADTIMLADSGLPPEPRTCMIAHDGLWLRGSSLEQTCATC